MLIAPDKREYQKSIFLFLHENMCYEYSLEAPRRGATNKYHKIFVREERDITIFGGKSVLSGAMGVIVRCDKLWVL